MMEKACTPLVTVRYPSRKIFYQTHNLRFVQHAASLQPTYNKVPGISFLFFLAETSKEVSIERGVSPVTHVILCIVCSAFPMYVTLHGAFGGLV